MILQFPLFIALLGLSFSADSADSVESGRKSVVEYPNKPIERLPVYSGEMILNATLQCYPSKSLFKARVDLVGRLTNTDQGISSYSQEYGQTIASTYAGLEARIPLYSDIELAKERKWEEERRQEAAKNVGIFLKAVSAAQLAKRKISIRKVLEAREAKRVAAGVAYTAEHVEQVEQLMISELDYQSALAQIEQSRTGLIAFCMEGREDVVKNLVDSIITDVVSAH